MRRPLIAETARCLSAPITLREKSGGGCPARVSFPPSRSHRVTLNSHEVLEHSQTKAPCYPARTDGLPTPNLSERTKGDSNRRSKTEEKCTSPTPIIITITPIIGIRPSGAVVDACSKCASCFRTAMQPSKIMSAKRDSRHINSVVCPFSI